MDRTGVSARRAGADEAAAPPARAGEMRPRRTAMPATSFACLRHAL
jgi:hypothetical protein